MGHLEPTDAHSSDTKREKLKKTCICRLGVPMPDVYEIEAAAAFCTRHKAQAAFVPRYRTQTVYKVMQGPKAHVGCWRLNAQELLVCC